MHIFHERIGQFEAALGYAQQSLVVTETLGDPASLALAQSLLGVSLHLAGEHRDALKMLEAAWRGPGTERISTVYGFDHRNRAGISLARELWLQGRPAQARQLAQQTVAEAAQMDHPITLCIALIWAVSIDLWTGDLAAAEENIDRFIAHAQSRSMGPLSRGRPRRQRRARDPARRRQERRRDDRALPARAPRVRLRAAHHHVQHRAGSGPSRARTIRAGRAADRRGDPSRRTEWRSPLHARAAAHEGQGLLSRPQPNIEEAERHIREALELSRRTGAKPGNSAQRLILPRFVADRGEAKRLLQSALEGFAEGSETADIKAGSALLEGL